MTRKTARADCLVAEATLGGQLPSASRRPGATPMRSVTRKPPSSSLMRWRTTKSAKKPPRKARQMIGVIQPGRPSISSKWKSG
jgi:hypothetical protein